MSKQAPKQTEPPGNLSIFPSHKLLICTTPRTASNTFMRMLHAANLGNPNEYFHSQTCANLCAEWNIPGPKGRDFDLARYLENLLHRQQHNSVFTAKIQFQHLFQFLLNDAGRGLFDGAKAVYLLRTNVAEQAASCMAANQSGVWGPDGSDISKTRPRRSSPYLVDAIRLLTRHDMYWRKFFAFAGIEPLIVTDQDIVLRPRETLAQIGQLLGVKPDYAAALNVAKNRGKYQGNSGAKTAILHKQHASLRKSAFDRASYAPESLNPLTTLLRPLLRGVRLGQ